MRLITVHNQGQRIDAITGIPIYTERIGAPELADETSLPRTEESLATYTASPVASNGKLYVVSDLGDIHVIDAGPFLEILGTYSVGEGVFSTPAISDGMFLVRGLDHLFAFSR